MPRIKSAKKALRQSKKNHKNNLIWKNRLKTAVKSTTQAIAKKDKSAGKLTAKTISIADICVKKNIYHQNKINRLKRKLLKKLNESQIKLEKRDRKTPKTNKKLNAKSIKREAEGKIKNTKKKGENRKLKVENKKTEKKIEKKKEKKKVNDGKLKKSKNI